MKSRYLILALVLLVGVVGWASSDDNYIDDVYYWETDVPVSSPSRDAAETQPSDNVQSPVVQITFIDDSITQHSDTVVKAIIRR